MVCHLFTRLYVNLDVKQLYVKSEKKLNVCLQHTHTHTTSQKETVWKHKLKSTQLCALISQLHILYN